MDKPSHPRVESDELDATVECAYSNIGREFIASLSDERGFEIVAGKGRTRSEALRALADEIDEYDIRAREALHG